MPEDALFDLENIDVNSLSEAELRNLVTHLRNQMRERYMYLVGEWQNGRRVKNTRNGQFASKEELLQYLSNN